MSYSYKHQVLIDSRDVDGRGCCKASALLGHLQEAATQAAEHGGFGREVLLREHNGFWMVTRVWFRLNRPLHWEEALTIHTWHRGGRSAICYRDYDLLVGDERVGEGVAAWVMADQNTRKLLRLGELKAIEGTDGGALCKSLTLSKLKSPRELHLLEQRRMRYSDTDINGHVNNTRYADFVCDALHMEEQDEDRFLSAMQIGYLAECHPGEVLTIQAGELTEGQYIRGFDESGKSRFEAGVFFGQVSH